MLYMATMTGPALDAMDDGALGAILTPDTWPRGYAPADRVAGWAWIADNACFNQGDNFDPDRWLAWLSTLPPTGCRFATAPDVVGDWPSTLDQAEFYLDRIRVAGFPAAIVLQDGATPGEVPWPEVDAVFVGGSTEWKLSDAARRICDEARWRGKWVHMGRVNSLERFKLAHSWRCHSVDGTYLIFGPDVNLPRLLSWITATRNREHQFALI